MAEDTPITFDEVVSRLGSPDSIRGDLAEFRRNALAFSADRPRLIDRYRERWVAVFGGGVAADGESFDAVMSEIDRLGLPRAQVMVRFVHADARTLIL